MGDLLREEDVRWKRGKSSRITAREPLQRGSSKRDAREQGETKKRKKLKYAL